MLKSSTTSPETADERPRLRVVRDEEAPPYDGEPIRVRRHMTVITDEAVDAVLRQCGMAAAGMYLYLERRVNGTGCCYPSYDTIASQCGITRRYAITLVAKLEAAGFVEVDPQQTDRGLPDANRFCLPLHNTSLSIPSEHSGEQGSEHLTRARRQGEVVRSSREVTPPFSPPTETKPKRATALPADFIVTDEMRAKAIGYGVPADRIDFETEKFRNRHGAKGSTFKDWRLAWYGWMQNAVSFGIKPSPNGVDRKAEILAAVRSTK